MRRIWMAWVLMLLASCDGGTGQSQLSQRTEPKVGDPLKGYDYLVNADYIGCGIPLSLMKDSALLQRLLGPVGDRLFDIFDITNASPQELPGRAGLNQNFPYHLTAITSPRGVPAVTMNCLLCHGEKVDGRVVPGLGNVTRDYSVNFGVVARMGDVMSYLKSPQEREEWKVWSRSLKAIAPYMILPTTGVNPAVNLTYAVMAHLDPQTLTFQVQPVIEPPSREVMPVDVPPWWRMKHRSSMFYNAEFAGEHRRYMMLASMICIDGVDMAERIEEKFVHIEAYIKSLEPPRYPYPIDKVLAAKGKGVFNDQCAGCHGHYEGDHVDYPEKVIPVTDVRTDPELWKLQNLETVRFSDWIEQSWYGRLGERQYTAGYIAPALNGIWATAPFLHNGSVPTIEGVLDSRKRPAAWRRGSELTNYNQEAMGWPFESLEGQRSRFGILNRFVYDTTRKGYSNAGHTFGDDLKDTERQAVLEYLKTL